MNPQDIHDLLTKHLRQQASHLGNFMRKNPIRFAYIIPTATKKGLEFKINDNKGASMDSLLTVKELKISPHDWEGYLAENRQFEGSLYDIAGELLSLRDIYKARWVATGLAAITIRKVMEVLSDGTSFIDTIIHVHRVIAPHIADISYVTLLRAQSNQGNVYDVSGYLYSRGNCAKDGYAPRPHFYWHVLVDGVPKKLELTASDNLFEGIELSGDTVDSLTHIYGNILAARMSQDTSVTFQLPEGIYQFVPEQDIKPVSSEHRLELEIKKAIGDSIPTDMVKRLRRVEQVLPYLEKNGVKPAFNIYKLPVFEFTTKLEAFHKVYVGINFVIAYDNEKRCYKEVLNTRKGHTLEQFGTILRQLTSNPAMSVFIQALYLNKRLPQV